MKEYSKPIIQADEAVLFEPVAACSGNGNIQNQGGQSTTPGIPTGTAAGWSGWGGYNNHGQDNHQNNSSSWWSRWTGGWRWW